MTRKDYRVIAQAIHERWEQSAHIQNGPVRRAHYAEIINSLAGVFAADNPRFDREKFQRACERGL